MKIILFVLVLVIAASINCQEIEEIETNIIPLATPVGFSESGHYGTHFATRKSYFRSNTHVMFK